MKLQISPRRARTGRLRSDLVQQGRLNFKAVQISGLVDSVGLILLDYRVPRPVMTKRGWGSRGGAAPTALGIILHRYPKPCRAGLTFSGRPYGLDELLGPTFYGLQ